MPKFQSRLDVAAATTETIVRRLPILWWAAVDPTPARTAEALRMVSEKQAAFANGMLRANQQMMIEGLTAWSSMMRGLNPFLSIHQAANRVTEAAAAPSIARVKANARRLRKRRSHV
jgi:hypothetical protein